MATQRASSALLILDMINTFDFPDGLALARSARRIAKPIALLRQKWRRAGQPVIYANDNFGQWRSDFQAVFALCSHEGARGRDVAHALQPYPVDYFILKPRHSAFFATPLAMLLDVLQVRRLVLTGVATESCVLCTALDAHMRDYVVDVVSDATASTGAVRHRRGLDALREVPEVRLLTRTRARPVAHAHRGEHDGARRNRG